MDIEDKILGGAAREGGLQELQDELGRIGATPLELFGYLRSVWISENITGDYVTYVEKVLGKQLSEYLWKGDGQKRSDLEDFAEKNNYHWGDAAFHIAHRATSYGDLNAVLPAVWPGMECVINQGYSLSVLPLPILIGDPDLLNKCIPKADFFAEHAAKRWDPYGIFEDSAKLFKDGFYLASQKFESSVLMNITSACPMGCVGCYKGAFTRILGRAFYTDLEKAVSSQARLLVAHLNEHPEIKSVIISGGEPLLLQNEGCAKLLSKFEDAEHLAELRICTGSIFQGLPFRIDDGLLDILEAYENKTAVKINFNAHLSHPKQFTPESLLAVRRITKRGFPINSQVPLQNGVNVFVGDYGKTIGTMHRLALLQGSSGVRPYKYILHMNVGSLSYSVPLEFILRLLGDLKYRIDHPIPETWQPVSCSILCSGGNILLSPQMLLSMKKEVDCKNDSVVYYLPAAVAGGELRPFRYSEPLMHGVNDSSKSLAELQEKYKAYTREAFCAFHEPALEKQEKWMHPS